MLGETCFAMLLLIDIPVIMCNVADLSFSVVVWLNKLDCCHAAAAAAADSAHLTFVVRDSTETEACCSCIMCGFLNSDFMLAG